ncbi:MAG: HTH-type transcriptional repressor RspR [Desulfovibrio sp.]
MGKTTLQQTAYELLKKRITSCEFPPGMFLNTVELQDVFGFSRTPIREALAKLEQDNLVDFYPQKGFVVSSVGLSTISAIYETRSLIEPHIVANYGHLVPKEELERMGGLFKSALAQETPSMALHIGHDDEFHALLRAACPNIYLVQVLENISSQAQRVRILSGYAGGKLKRLCLEHMDIIDAMLSQNFSLAGKKMAVHLAKARKNAFKAIS